MVTSMSGMYQILVRIVRVGSTIFYFNLGHGLGTDGYILGAACSKTMSFWVGNLGLFLFFSSQPHYDTESVNHIMTLTLLECIFHIHA